MKYFPELGIFGNIAKLFEERNKTNDKVYTNKAETDSQLTEIEANYVEAVCDEFNALIGEEE